jgi:hypothetical protein
LSLITDKRRAGDTANQDFEVHPKAFPSGRAFLFVLNAGKKAKPSAMLSAAIKKKYLNY